MTKLELHPVLIWLGATLISLMFFAIIALVTGEFTASSKGITFSNDYSLFVDCLFGIPAVCFFYCFFPKYFGDCLNQLHRNGVIGTAIKRSNRDKDKVYNFSTFLDDAARSLSSKGWWIISVVIIVIFMVLTNQANESQFWTSRHLSTLILAGIFWFIIFLVAVILVFRVIAGIWWINQAFKQFHVTIRPLHPDKVGGLSPLNRLSMQLGMMIFIIGLQLGANQFAQNYFYGVAFWSPEIIIPWVFYILLAPIVFFAPLAAAHKGMQEAKHTELLVLSEHFEHRYKLLRNQLNEDLDTERKTNTITEIYRLYEMVETFPVWPFQIQKFIQFSITVLVPLLLAILAGYIVEIAKKWIGL
jgi:hypothetical protein